LGNISATGTLSITLQDSLGIAGGNTGTVTAPTMAITGVSGNVGSSASLFTVTNVANFDVNTTGTSGGAAYVKNLDNAGSGINLSKNGVSGDTTEGVYHFESTGNITVIGI